MLTSHTIWCRSPSSSFNSFGFSTGIYTHAICTRSSGGGGSGDVRVYFSLCAFGVVVISAHIQHLCVCMPFWFNDAAKTLHKYFRLSLPCILRKTFLVLLGFSLLFPLYSLSLACAYVEHSSASIIWMFLPESSWSHSSMRRFFLMISV